MALSSSLVNLILQKGGLAKDVGDRTFTVLQQLKVLLQKMEYELKKEVAAKDSRIKIQYRDRGTFEAELKVADDLLIFIMHTNALVFDASHPIWKTGYVSLDNSRGTVGMISIYNFLSDSFKFDRKNDTGQLVGRMFINREGNFFVEGKRQLGILYNDYANTKVSDETLRGLIEGSLSYSLDIDINVPPLDSMREISVFQAMVNTMQSSVSTGKRLGFKWDEDKNLDG